MAKGTVTISRDEINALIEDIWRIRENFTAAQRGLEALENQIAAIVPDNE